MKTVPLGLTAWALGTLALLFPPAGAVPADRGVQDPAPGAHQEESAAEENPLEVATRLYGQTCRSCHAPPDPAFYTDRAWLHQVRDTA